MAKVHIHSGQGAVGIGDLQLQNGAPMDATLRPVTDAANTASPLELSTGLVAVTSTLQIATNDTEYIDAEDGSGNNRFTVSRASGSQVVNVDYASNPTSATDQVGAIRTYADGASLSNAVSFLRNGIVGVGTSSPSGYRLHVEAFTGGNGIKITRGSLTQFNVFQSTEGTSHIGSSGANGTLVFRTGTTFGTDTERMRITSAGNVGIGTTSPSVKLQVDGESGDLGGFFASDTTTGAADTGATILVGGNDGAFLRTYAFIAGRKENSTIGNYSGYLSFATRPNGSSTTERMRITSAGNVGIGTNNPDTTLRVKGIGGFLDSSLNDTGVRVGANENYYWQISRENLSFGYLSIIEKDNTTPVERLRFTQATAGSYLRLASGTGGIQFNGDTAAANALDDYEEGTFTPTVYFGVSDVGFVYSARLGKYTKVGNVVTIEFGITLTTKGSGSGDVKIGGLPFNNASAYRGGLSIGNVANISFANQFFGFIEGGFNEVYLRETTEAGVTSALNDSNFANNSSLYGSLTYLV